MIYWKDWIKSFFLIWFVLFFFLGGTWGGDAKRCYKDKCELTTIRCHYLREALCLLWCYMMKWGTKLPWLHLKFLFRMIRRCCIHAILHTRMWFSLSVQWMFQTTDTSTRSLHLWWVCRINQRADSAGACGWLSVLLQGPRPAVHHLQILINAPASLWLQHQIPIINSEGDRLGSQQNFLYLLWYP